MMSTHTSRHQILSVGVMSLLSTCLSQGATAQGGEPAGDTTNTTSLEEITITAERRTERLEDTPISITAFTSAAIERVGANDIEHLANMTPNVRFDFTAPISGASDAAGIFIRGVGQADFALTTEAGVGTYVDGVYVSRSVGGVLDALDIDRMEILRGPQGTLFGRNTIGGAINITSVKPTDQFEGTGSVELGSFDRRYLRGAVNIPINDILKIRVTASSKEEDGYVHSIVTPQFTATSLPPGQALPGATSPIDYGNQNRQAARMVALLTPSDQFTATLTADMQRVRENNAPSVLVGVTGANNPALGPIVYFYNLVQAPVTTLPGFPNAQYSCANFCTGGNHSTTYATGPNGTSINAWGPALTLAYRPQEGLELKSISAYHEESGYFNRDADESPIDLTQTSDYAYRHRQFSEELQANGSALQRLKYAVGLYYFRETGSDPNFVTFPSSFGTLNIDKDQVENTSAAAYAQATLTLLPRLSLTGGLRYTRDHKTFDTDQYLTTGTSALIGDAVFGGAPPGTVIPLVPPNSHVASTFTNTSPHASLDYKLADDVLVYTSYSEGYKGGGFNLRYVAPSPAVVPFDPEKVRTWEAGIKAELLERRLRMNLAAFTTNYDHMQLTEYQELGAPLTVNAGDSRIRGGELELVAAPLQGLELSYSLGILSAHYTSLIANAALNLPPEVQIGLNSKLQKTPPNENLIGIDYRLPKLFPAGGNFVLHADWRFTADTYNDAQNSVFLYQPAYNIGNASIGWQADSGKWSLRFMGYNLTNRQYIVSGDSNYGIGFHEAEFNRPREWVVAAEASF